MAQSTCFVIAPIGEEGSDERNHSDQVLEYIIEPVVTGCGFDKPVRADAMSKPGQITNQVIEQLMVADLVVADLSFRNPNVFYELAIRHALRKPVVQIILKNEKVPFDVSPIRTIQFTLDLGGVKQCNEALKAQIQAAMKDPSDVDTPITSTLNLQMLKSSDNPIERGNAEILSILQQLSLQMDEVSSVVRMGQSSVPAYQFKTSNTYEPAIRASKHVEILEPGLEEGFVLLEVTRSVPVATGSLRFDANFAATPSLKIQLVNGPARNVRWFGGLGSNGDFNVHLNSVPKGSHLPVGLYLLSYVANDVPSNHHEDLPKQSEVTQEDLN